MLQVQIKIIYNINESRGRAKNLERRSTPRQKSKKNRFFLYIVPHNLYSCPRTHLHLHTQRRYPHRKYR